jgi:hypothetical protein
MPGDVQKIVLRLAYLVAIAGALLPFLNWKGVLRLGKIETPPGFSIQRHRIH